MAKTRFYLSSGKEKLELQQDDVKCYLEDGMEIDGEDEFSSLSQNTIIVIHSQSDEHDEAMNITDTCGTGQ